MEWYDDSQACLDVANDMLIKLSELISEALEKPNETPYVKVYVKNILENLRAPLDYSTTFIFETYCKDQYPSKSQMDKAGASRPQIPIKDKANDFDITMNKKYKNLKRNQPEIYALLESIQYFNNNSWLKNLNTLVNSNKHRHLSKHAVKEYGIQVKILELNNGGIFKNIGAFNSGKHNIVIDDIPFNEDTAETHPHVKHYEADFIYSLYFSGTNQEIKYTLNNIYKGVSEYISDLKEIIDKQNL